MPLLDIFTKKENKPAANVDCGSVTLEHQLFALSAQENRTLVGTCISNSNDNYVQHIETGRKFHHRLPPSKVCWGSGGELFASTSTSLRLWRATEEKPILKLYPSNKSGASLPCPLTSLSWNNCNPSKIATSAVDTTISVWDLEKANLETQLVAHDKPVLDVAYGSSMHQFVSVSEDGSLRLFDTRDLDHSTILYEDSVPLLRVTWLESQPNLIATLAADRTDILLFDIRKSGFLAGVIRLGPALPNAIAWSASGSLAVGMSDGSVAVCTSISETIQHSGENVLKLKPDRMLPPPKGYTGGGLTNITWCGTELALVHGATVCMQMDAN
jgi:WD40 repeat protein